MAEMETEVKNDPTSNADASQVTRDLAATSIPTLEEAAQSRLDQRSKINNILQNASNSQVVPLGKPEAPPAAPDMSRGVPAPGSFADMLNRAAIKIGVGNPALVKQWGPVGLMGIASMGALADATKGGAWQQAQTDDTTQPTTGAPQPAPQSRVSGAVNELLKNLGDTAQNPQTGFQGITQTLGNRNKRQTDEQNDRMNMALSNIRMIHEQALVHKMGEDEIAAAAKTGNEGYQALLNTVPPGRSMATDKTSDEIKEMIQKGTLDPSKQTVFLTGRKPAGTDANGVQQWRSTYSVVLPAGPVKLSPHDADFFADELSIKTRGDNGETITLEAPDYTRIQQLASSKRAADMTRDAALAEQGIKIEKGQIHDEANRLSENPRYVQTLNAVKTSPSDPYAPIKAYNVLMNDQNFLATPEGKHFSAVFQDYVGGGDKFKQMQENYEKFSGQAKAKAVDVFTDDKFIAEHPAEAEQAAEMYLKTPGLSPDQIKAAKDGAEKARLTQHAAIAFAADRTGAEARVKKGIEEQGLGNTALTGEAFLDTLTPSQQALVKSIDNGTSLITASLLRSPSNKALLAAVHQYDPQFDESRLPAYEKARINFTSGPTNKSIVAAQTALKHADLYTEDLKNATGGITGSVEQYFGYNKEGRRLADVASGLSSELGRLYSGGVVTVAEKADWEPKLNPNSPGMTVNKLNTNIQAFIEMLGGRLETHQAEWDKAVPSPRIAAPMVIATKKDKEIYKRVTGKELDVHDVQPGFNPATNAPLAKTGAMDLRVPPQFPTATGVAPGSDGKMYYHDRAGKILGLAPQE